MGNRYSSKSTLSAKLVCEDCGGFYGSKVWHSTDKYRHTIWQCNSKFGHEEHCHTPTVGTDTVQKLFIQAYNQLMQNRREVIEDCEEWCRVLTDCTDLDKEIDRQYEETQVVGELVKAAVSENASTAQSQEDYLKKYKALTQRYDTAVAALAELQATRAHKEQQNKQMSLFIRTLKKQPEMEYHIHDSVAEVVFGIAWATDYEDTSDCRTWYAADPTLDME